MFSIVRSGLRSEAVLPKLHEKKNNLTWNSETTNVRKSYRKVCPMKIHKKTLQPKKAKFVSWKTSKENRTLCPLEVHLSLLLPLGLNRRKWYIVYFLYWFCDSANNKQFLIKRKSYSHFDLLVTHVDPSFLTFSLKMWGSEKEPIG